MSNNFISLWQKYRPAILKLMVDSLAGPQKYRFLYHEFQNEKPNQRNYTFTLRLFKNRAINNIKDSVVARDLLVVLKQSNKVSELTELVEFEFILDKDFILHIKQETAPTIAETEL